VFREATARDGSAFQRDAAERMRRQDDPKAAQILAVRSRVSEAVQAGDAARAGAEYRALLDTTTDGALGRPAQLALGNLLYSAGDGDGAAAAYEHFLKRYGSDPESARVRLMLALLHARTLNDPVRAKALVAEAMPGLKTEDERGLARELLEELG
jgi:TolA-binding protein